MLSPEHEALNFMINCPAWDALYKKRMGERAQECIRTLLDPSLPRKERCTDDYLRGFYRALAWAVEWPAQEIETALLEENDLTNEDDPHMSLGRNRG